MRLGLALALPMLQTSGGGGGGGASVLASVDATGYTGQYATSPPTFQPDTSPITQTITRQGFDNTGAATTFSENLIVTSRVRQAYPNQGAGYPSSPTYQANTVALSATICAADMLAGVTNNSTQVSPVPICNWVLPDRQVIGDTLHLELVAFHWAGKSQKPVACVVFTATDGTHTATATVTAPTMLNSSFTGDQHPVIGYQADLDISAFTNPATVTADAKAYPWIGTSASVADSSTGTADSRFFCTKTYRRDTTKFASPPMVYVTATGTDATVDVNGQAAGITKVSTNATTAKANAFATIVSAYQALKAATNVTGGVTDGCRLRISNVTVQLASTPTTGTYQSVAECIIEADPLETKASCVFQFGAVNTNWRSSWLRFRNLTITRTGTLGMGPGGGTASHTVVESCDLNNASNNAAFVTSSQGALYILGCNATNQSASTFAPGASAEVRMARGLSQTGGNLEAWLVVGCDLTTPGSLNNGSRSESGMIFAFNAVKKLAGNQMLTASSADQAGLAIVQNVFEFTSSTSNAALRASGDSDTGKIVHACIWNNTFAGAFNAGRWNCFYDEKPVATARPHAFVSLVGNSLVAFNIKGDVFLGLDGNGTPDPTDAPNHTGNWGVYYGADCAYNFSQYVDALNGNGEAMQAYPGIGSSIGTGKTTATKNDPKFTSDQSTTTSDGTTYVAGAGGGNYAPLSGSPLKSRMVARSLLPYDLAGTSRPTSSDSSGAYV